LSKQIDYGLQLVGQCKFSADFKLAPGIPGVDYSSVVLAVIPFSSGSQSEGTATATGAAIGSGPMTSSGEQAKEWIGHINIPAANSKFAGGKTSSVSVTASTGATVPKSPDGTCPGASISSGPVCLQIVRL